MRTSYLLSLTSVCRRLGVSRMLQPRKSLTVLLVLLLVAPAQGAQFIRMVDNSVYVSYTGAATGIANLRNGPLTLTTTGSYTFTVSKQVGVLLRGAAGGAGGGTGAGAPGLGGGGGAANIAGLATILVPGVTYTVLVGAGAPSLGNGSDGAETSVHNGTSYVTRWDGGKGDSTGGTVLAGAGLAGGLGADLADPACTPNCGTTKVNGARGLAAAGGTGGGGQGGGSGDSGDPPTGGSGGVGGNGGAGGLGGAASPGSPTNGASSSATGGAFGFIIVDDGSSGGGGGGGGVNAAGQCNTPTACYGGGGGGGGGTNGGLGGAGRQGFFYIGVS